MALPVGVPVYTLDRDHPYIASFKAAESVRSQSPRQQGERQISPHDHRLARRSTSSATKRRLLAASIAVAGSTNPAGSDFQRLACAIERTHTPSIEAFELSETSPRGKSTTRPKHIPIVIPDYESFGRQSPVNDSRNGSFSTFYTSSSQTSLPVPALDPTSRSNTPGSVGDHPRYVEIKIPEWAQPVIRRPSGPPRIDLTKSTFVDPFADLANLSPPDMSRPTPESSRTNTMNSDAPSPTGLYINPTGSNNGYLNSANSSQSSLIGMRAEYESASEAEAEPTPEAEPRQPSHTPSQSTTGPSPHTNQTPPEATPGTANLSGLVCNVHRTTGKEPPPLVGATTTILGDKLYVFGGRKLSRAQPQLTSNLYELDLIHRHWTKLTTQGDIPPARYFHSVCALGDTKLVCYGGMSPNPSGEVMADGQSDIIVMSDIHIYEASTRTWQKVAAGESPQGRYAHCTTILPSSAVFGSATAPLSALHHNPAGTQPNQGTLGVQLDGTGGAEMVVVGGQDSANHYIEQISIFNLRSLKWTGTTGMGRSCGAYRSVVAPLTTMSAQHIGAGPHAGKDDDEDDEPTTVGSGAPMLIYSNYNFLDVKLELQVRLPSGELTEKLMQSDVSPPGLRFPNGGVIDNHFVVSGTFLTASKQEYALWALDLRTLSWSRIDASGSIFSQGSWNRGILWSRRNAFVILGNRKRSLVDDYNNRRINFSNICLVELESFGLSDNPRSAEPTSGYVSASAGAAPAASELSLGGRQLTPAAESLGVMSMTCRELCDVDILANDGTRIPVNSRLVSRRWGSYFTSLLRDSHPSTHDTDTATLRPSAGGHPSRNSSMTITASLASAGTTLTNNTMSEIPDVRSLPPASRSRLLYLPHTTPTVHALLHYLYTGTLPSPPSSLATPQIYCSLLQLARPYKVDGLLEAVVQRLHESLDGRNAAAIFNAAAMAAGGGENVVFTSANGRVMNRESAFPQRNASLANNSVDLGHGVNGLTRSAASLRIDTDMANGRNTRNTLRPGQVMPLNEDTDDESVPGSAATEGSMSESESALSARSLRGEGSREMWNGALNG
ncbi:hypothetical protein B0A48_02123 [Cryoendolithus antarcticus]|uniref:BTB domain-containing protein n=1 Tax=Cryoendolithus antarcticus TaxID=1507870 RepID=A0A1V8TMS2_9PEZI|nr:hypothetical protein B0A48_02123 [Cryoendolithus antarcticus]